MPPFLLPPRMFESEALSNKIRPANGTRKSAILLIAKSAFAASPHRAMQRMTDLVASSQSGTLVRFAFTEQGTPSLHEALSALLDEEVDEIFIVPLVLPMEPSFHIWLKKSLTRWKSSDDRPWPVLSIARDIASSALMGQLLNDLLATADELQVPAPHPPPLEGSLVPAQKRRVLVCEGGACNLAGADAIWGHLRNQQERLKLRVIGDGTMTAKSTCLGPCNLAPVLQVFPEGTYYGGVTEQAVNRIITEHLLAGQVVEDFAYHPTGRKQRLRNPSLTS
ncbi:NAD(P)H-dependent oxidoreductase subunit E [Rhizobium sp. NTR19]|uniref:NAD(P)H-dependent oxidoreductase subunit E n=1 Tax=Neorhizobium turbinariae TaxID=2937795 RepID=A0ABT0IWP1_9HYPH|nr:(2Fe-2S) ferredoxin domain-containing protein [Neorhizobium turbinariae]MCK8782274.1 NAD(P)H-dependent oxidoreductase subunit E [Neorhizobium turbinariae]